MKLEKLVGERFKERPADCVIDSHAIMVKGGYIKYMANGIYSSYLPLRRIVRKIEQILREEMDKIDGQEVQFPVVMPASLWDESGRYDSIGDELLRFTDRNNAKMVLGMTHEEAAVHLVREYAQSYTKYPFMIYQIQTKFHDEARPRAGLIRVREFTMKDAYSFDADEDGLDVSYHQMYDAYTRIFTRCGLYFKPVEADSGAIGGSNSHEFMALAEAGEADVIHCKACDYAANIEIGHPTVVEMPEEELKEMTLVDTPEAKTIEAVANMLNLPLDHTIKAVVYNLDGIVTLAIVRGDHEVNEIALQHVLNSPVEPEMASDEDLHRVGLVGGFISPVGLKQTDDFAIVVDESVMAMYNACGGANKKDAHYININPNRDFNTKDMHIAPIRLITTEDRCPKCGGELEIAKGIEVGQVFKLGTKYSEALGATFLTQEGRPKPLVMGCYGIGVSRTLAAAIEQFHDDNGIIWPRAIAPFEAVVVPINAKDEALMATATKVYEDLKAAGVDALLDDRKERAGVKFKDADLIGYPIRITISKMTLETGEAEVKIRKTGDVLQVPLAEAAVEVAAKLNEL